MLILVGMFVAVAGCVYCIADEHTDARPRHRDPYRSSDTTRVVRGREQPNSEKSMRQRGARAEQSPNRERPNDPLFPTTHHLHGYSGIEIVDKY